MLPFPPRVFAKEYLAINPLGTIPFMIDGETKMTESSGICHYLGTRYGPTPLMVGVDDPAYGAFLNWMYFSDATLTFPQTLVLRYSQLEPEERRNPQVADRLRQMVPRAAAGRRSRDRQGRDAVRRPLHRGRYRDRLRAAACRKHRAGKGFRAQRRRLLAAPAAARRLSSGPLPPKTSPASSRRSRGAPEAAAATPQIVLNLQYSRIFIVGDIRRDCCILAVLRERARTEAARSKIAPGRDGP